MSKLLIVGTVLSIGLIAGLTLAKDENTPAATGAHDFGNKLLIVVPRGQAKGNEAGGMYLEQVKIQRLGSVDFLVGKVPDMEAMFKDYKGYKGVTMWIPVTEILHMSEYDSFEAFQKKYETSAKESTLKE